MPNSANEKNFLRFYDKNVAGLYRYVYFRVGSREQAQDLTSECFFRFLRNTSEIENPRAFLYQIARNLLVDHYRQTARQPLSLEEITENRPDFSDIDIDLLADAQRAEELKFIKRCLDKLKQDYQEVIILRYIDELEIKEIAEIVEKKEGAVRVLISRALKALKRELKKV